MRFPAYPKSLYWERNGFCLWQKKLERERFKWPGSVEGAVSTLTGRQLNWLLMGTIFANTTARGPEIQNAIHRTASKKRSRASLSGVSLLESRGDRGG
jgi:transposase